ncbi:hypothetical protein Tco_1100314 [Tanacetum coccineum]
MKSQTRCTRSREKSAQPHLVFTNDDLLSEILIRLPILCIYLFTTVSKQWLQILTSPDFTNRRRKIPNLDPPAGIFANHLTSLFECDFVSLDSRFNSKKSTMDHPFGSAEEVDHVRIFTSVFRLAFDPRKSLSYKVVQAGRLSGETEIQIYSTETGSWSLCKDRDDIGSTEFSIYEMMKGSFVWSVKCLVNIEQLMNLLLEGWSNRTSVWSICLGEGEENAFVVINLSGKVVRYNLISRTNTEIFDIRYNQMDDDDDEVEFIRPFEVDPNLYEFIPSLASV